jgi:F0F1-type ATP synthase delta subunit
MKVARHTLAEAIAQRTMHVQDSKLLAKEIAAYLLEERRTSELESVLRDIMQYRADQGILEAKVISAHEVHQEVLNDVKQLLHTAYPAAKTIHVSPRIDSDVIGGIRIDMPNEQLDLTVAAKLATLKRLTAIDKE